MAVRYKRKTYDVWDIEALYCHGWELVTCEISRKLAVKTIDIYRDNEPGIRFRIIKRRERIGE